MEDIKEIKEKIVPILRGAEIKRSAIFGSFVEQKQSAESDIDILVEFEGDKTLLDLVALKIKLEKILKRNVDILTYKSLSPPLRERILKSQVPIYG